MGFFDDIVDKIGNVFSDEDKRKEYINNYCIKQMFNILENKNDSEGNAVFLIEMPWLRENPDEFREIFDLHTGFILTYYVTGSKGETIQGSLDPATMKFELHFTKDKFPAGVYSVKVTGRNMTSSDEKVIWKQDIFVQHRPSLPVEKIDELARKYAPILIFSQKEDYFPISLQDMFNDPEVMNCEDVIKLKTITGKEAVPLCRLGDFMCYNGHSDYLLDFNLFNLKDSPFSRLNGAVDNSTLYYSFIDDIANNRFFINYHMFYAFDTKAGMAKLTGVGPHNFDRESMTIVFDKNKQPLSLILSGHLEDQKIFFLENLKIWSQARVNVDFNDSRTLKIDTHPVIAVAEGSHALYPISGVYNVLSMLQEMAGFVYNDFLDLFDFNKKYSNNVQVDQLIVPDILNTEQLHKYTLKSLAFDKMNSNINPDETTYDGYNSYLVFSGYWVDVAGPQNAKFPPFTKKETGISEWVDNAFNWDWVNIPESLFRNNAMIKDFLIKNIN